MEVLDRLDRDQQMRWEDDGGSTIRSQKSVQNAKEARLHLVLVACSVVIAHLTPFLGAFGCPPFCKEGFAGITIVFGYLSAFLLTTRVVFEINSVYTNCKVASLMFIECIGGAVVLAWLAPVYVTIHGGAEVAIAVMGIVIALFASFAFSQSTALWTLTHDVANLLVVLIAFAWTIAIPEIGATPHGDLIPEAMVIGSASLHSFRTLFELHSDRNGDSRRHQ